MTKEKEIKYLESQIKEFRDSISNQHSKKVMAFEFEYFEEEYPGWTDDWLVENIKNLYLMTMTYFELKGVSFVKESFKNIYENLLKGKEKYPLLIEAMIDPEETVPELVFLTELRNHLRGFEAFRYIPRNEHPREEVKLISILRNTGVIVSKLNGLIGQTHTQKEADIYNKVKLILEFYYHSIKGAKSAFIGRFKHYKPDILIPELKTAIEYKYIDSEQKNIDDYIDQIHVDSINYVNDSNYDHFIAVIYIENVVIATPEAIQNAWNNKRFSKNWRLIISGNFSTN